MRERTQSPIKKPQPYYPHREPEMEWLRPLLWFGGIGIFVLLLVLGNLPG